MRGVPLRRKMSVEVEYFDEYHTAQLVAERGVLLVHMTYIDVQGKLPPLRRIHTGQTLAAACVPPHLQQTGKSKYINQPSNYPADYTFQTCNIHIFCLYIYL